MVEDICSDVLIMEKGEKTFVGTIAQLKAKFAGRSADSTLEDIFFQAVENQSIDAPSLGIPVAINPTLPSSTLVGS
jgi:ABC-type multidrug transport system ATPase subunit